MVHVRARADEQRVTIACPQLDREGVAELESLARAALLSSSLRASLAIECRVDGVLVTAESAETSASVRASPEGATFRDGVLAAVDAALDQLRPRAAPAVPGPAGEVSQPEPEVTAPPAAQQEVTTPPVPKPRPAPPAALTAPANRATPNAQPPSRTLHTEVYASAGLEAWSVGLAGTATLGARHGGRHVWAGIRGGVARPLLQDVDFSATDLSLTLEAVFVPDLGLGLRAALGVGPSVLVVSPSARVAAVSNVKTAALLVAAELSRPVWLGRFAVVPALGVRVFASERGVRLDGAERLVLGGYEPSVLLGLTYRLD